MRRESSTVVVLVGEVDDELLTDLASSPNISVARAGAARAGAARAPVSDVARPGWEPGALAMRAAARQRSPYVIVPDDPLASVAAGWRAMWDVSAGAGQAGLLGPAEFEQSAAEALAAWRDKRFELPDYYLVMTDPFADDAGPDMYLGPLRAVRPRRVAVTGAGVPGVAEAPIRAARVIEALRSLEHGPWWPALDDLLDTTRNFYAGDLVPGSPSSVRS
jgi:hypothetical protein